jgi:hypothetical protein
LNGLITEIVRRQSALPYSSAESFNHAWKKTIFTSSEGEVNRLIGVCLFSVTF